ncbi:sigma-70 family RNA polymerase sigma factor [Amycolatopsis ultiminotia]|uniref:Sigma-70 family RNA polymerase sigma factor n=1 Tax=Amycolatopsis ultiminotia TaxID=543629 RepID=A0ABP6UX13_9PSEU
MSVSAQAIADPEWLAEVYRRCHRDVYRYVRTWSVSPSVAEDFVSETFLRAARHVLTLKQRQDSVVPWLYRVAKNVILDDRKSARSRRLVVLDEVPEQPAYDELFEDRLTRKWLVAEVGKCVARLSQAQRRCLDLRFGDGCSVAETAKQMDRTETAVRQLQYRALMRLGSLLPATVAPGGS